MARPAGQRTRSIPARGSVALEPLPHVGDQPLVGPEGVLGRIRLGQAARAGKGRTVKLGGVGEYGLPENTEELSFFAEKPKARDGRRPWPTTPGDRR